MAADATPLHVFFLPFPAAGHSIPMLDVAALFASRGATSTIVLLRADDDSADSTSNSNRCGGGDNDDNDDNGGLRFLSLPFSYAAAGIAEGEAPLPSAYATPEFEAALDAVGEPFLELLKAHRPDCIVADLQIPFAAEHAAALAIPHLTLQVTCAFSLIVMGIITHAKPHLGVASPSEPFVVPGLPHRIELTPAQLPSHLTAQAAAERNRRILAAQRSGGGGGGGGCSLGMILNTFRALEPAYVDMLRRAGRFSAWVWSDRSEERGLVAAEAVAAAISRVMGDGAEAEGRRRRAREIAEEARRAVAEGGTANDDMARLVAEILRIKEEKKKKKKMEEEEEEEM
uniref:Uncharacterized protein n=1 Tax=Ananas comosus var. bracteatus TaxID=296719 RepID=A0A6V7QID6_ANACO|nr:unnamed protein product [Ananas comosus var. bracteatus]